jgi:mycothiol synthase
MDTSHFDRLLAVGFTIRPATLDDLEAGVELFNICSLDFMGEVEVRLEDLRRGWALERFDPEQSTRMVFSPHGKPVGHIEVWDLDCPPVDIWVWGRVHPGWEGRGIGTAMMNWARDRARLAIVDCPDQVRIVMRSGAFSTHTSGLKLLQDQGMKLIRHNYRMSIELGQPIPDPAWPEGIMLRPYDHARDSRAVYRAETEALRDHWGYVDQPFEYGYQSWERSVTSSPLDYDPTFWFIAVEGSEIAGLCICLPSSLGDPDMGWVELLAVRRPYRRQGLGRALLQHAFQEFRKRGKSRVGLGVDAGNLTGAVRLYERAGMKVQRRFDIFEQELRPGEDTTLRDVTRNHVRLPPLPRGGDQIQAEISSPGRAREDSHGRSRMKSRIQIKGVLWDLGGVIVRTEEWSWRKRWEDRLGIPEGGLHDLVFDGEYGQLAMIGRATSGQVWNAIGDRFNLSPREREEIQADFWRGDRLDEALVCLIRELKQSYKTGLISNAWSDLRDALVHRWQIADAFDDLVISAEVGIRKPDPRIFDISLSNLGLMPDEAVFVDDQDENLEAARRLGLGTVKFSGAQQAVDELKTLLAAARTDGSMEDR